MNPRRRPTEDGRASQWGDGLFDPKSKPRHLQKQRDGIRSKRMRFASAVPGSLASLLLLGAA